MRTALNSKVILGLVVFAAGLLYFVVASRPSLGAETLFQSRPPPPPQPTGNPYMVKADAGGQISCGLSQSPVWLEIPPGFTSDWGAELHCDLTGSLMAWNDTHDALYDRGYLIGLYPATAPILQPMSLVFEIDPAQISGTLVARSYHPATRQWRDLTAEYNRMQQRLRVKIPPGFVASSYPGYEDRFLIAVFPARFPTSSATTPTPTRGQSRPATDTRVASAPAAATLSTKPGASPTGTSLATATRTASPTVFVIGTAPVSRVPTITVSLPGAPTTPVPSSSTPVPAIPSSLPCQASTLLVAMSIVLAVRIHRRG